MAGKAALMATLTATTSRTRYRPRIGGVSPGAASLTAAATLSTARLTTATAVTTLAATAPAASALAAVALAGVYFLYSATVEERYMAEQFPDRYPAYKHSTKMLVPFVF